MSSTEELPYVAQDTGLEIGAKPVHDHFMIICDFGDVSKLLIYLYLLSEWYVVTGKNSSSSTGCFFN